jgi:hypothetical protein
MQSRETAQAPEQAPDAMPQDTPPKQNNRAEQVLDQLTELAALSWSVTSHYTEQIKLTGETAKAEWQLSGRSLTLAAAIIVCFGAGVILLWGSILLVLGYVIFQLTSSLAISAAALLLLQFGLLLWCWRSLGYVLSQVGFQQTWQQLQRILTTENNGAAHAD